MRRILACALFGVFLAALAWPPPPVYAQQDETARRQVEERTRQWQDATNFTRLWLRLQQAQDPEEQITLADQALKAERDLHQWSLRHPRDELRARLWWMLGAGYAERTLGERAENLERAITAYGEALQFFRSDTAAGDWASLQINLGAAYGDRVRGDRAENLERAIAHFEAALTVNTRAKRPREWAVVQTSLGHTYQNRVRGERPDNLEKAIASYEAALTVLTRRAQPREWALAQGNLAVAYTNRIHGDQAQNLEKATAASEASLAVFTREAWPREWAQTQVAIANSNSRGEHESAIGRYEAALSILTRAASPVEWARIQSLLGWQYQFRSRGEWPDNLEKAARYYEAALTVFTRETSPEEWAVTQNKLGIAYRDPSLRGDRADNLEKAIVAYEAANSVWTRETSPDNWFSGQINLAVAYLNRIRGERADNVEKAIAAVEAAALLRRSWPTETNLGRAYLNRVHGDRQANVHRAIAHYEASVSLATHENLTVERYLNGRDLGDALMEAGEWYKAGMAYERARELFLQLFGQGLDEANSRRQITGLGSLFAHAAFVAAHRAEFEKALTLASEGRARQLAVSLKLQTLDLPAAKRGRLDEVRRGIRAEERLVEAAVGLERTTAVQRLVGLRQELVALVGSDSAAEKRPWGVLAQAQAVIGERGVIVAPILTKFGSKILIVSYAGLKPAGSDAVMQPTSGGAKVSNPGTLTPSFAVLDLPELTTDRLNVLMHGDARDRKTGGWVDAYKINYLEHSEQSQRWPEWLAAVGNLGPNLWHLFGARLDATLKERGIKPGARLLWLPTGALGILPLGLAQDPASKRYLADTYEIIYAPSLEAIALAQNRIANTTPATLAAIINPTEDLPGTEKEGKVVASHFSSKSRTVVARRAATPDAVLAALKGKTHWHFASHGTFSWDDARKSALLMHGQAPLSVGRLLEADGLGRPRLVVLSACETGLYDIDRNPDEFIGLPGTFTALGAAGVLGTLWPVSDAATALLISKFYELHIGGRLVPPTALARAQAWLRQATNAELEQYVRVAAKKGRLEARHVAEIGEELSEKGLARSRNAAAIEWIAPPEEARGPGKKTLAGVRRLARPYAHPYFWAGFIYTGV